MDGLAYDNPPGAAHASRWEDVNELLDAGISVITSINIQYIDDLRERVQQITGKKVTQTVPRSFLNSADEIVVVDAPPEMCIASEGRMGAGSSGPEQKLSELRELALLLAADVVDKQLEAYLQRNGIPQTFGAQERILVCITPRANAAPMIESGKRNADRFHGDLTVAYVRQAENIRPRSRGAGTQACRLRAKPRPALRSWMRTGSGIETLLKSSLTNTASPRFSSATARTPTQWWERFSGTPARIAADSRRQRHRRESISPLAMSDRPPSGKLKIFLGYAAGVGKTYQMLEEAQAAKRQRGSTW